MEAIDLGRESGALCEPSKPEKSKHYPSLYIDGGKDLADIPESGEMTVYFKVTSRSSNDQNGKVTRSVCLEVRQILDVEADENGKSERKSTEDALDGYMEEESKK